MKSHLALQNPPPDAPPPPPPPPLPPFRFNQRHGNDPRRLGVGSHQETRETSRYSQLVPQKRGGGSGGGAGGGGQSAFTPLPPDFLRAGWSHL